MVNVMYLSLFGIGGEVKCNKMIIETHRFCKRDEGDTKETCKNWTKETPID